MTVRPRNGIPLFFVRAERQIIFIKSGLQVNRPNELREGDGAR